MATSSRVDVDDSLVVLVEQVSHALANGYYVGTINRVGREPLGRRGVLRSEAASDRGRGSRLRALPLSRPLWPGTGGTGIRNRIASPNPDGHPPRDRGGASVVGRRPGTKGDDGIELVIVRTDTPGITQTQLKTIAADKQAEVKFENVRVPASNMLLGEGRGFDFSPIYDSDTFSLELVFGAVSIDGKSKVATVSLRNLRGEVLYSVELHPER